MRIKLTFIIFTIIVILSCKKKEDQIIPKACFDYSATRVFEEYDTIKFENCSENSIDYLWDFGDNNTSLDKTPIHIYKQNGNYSIKLIATNLDGKDSMIKIIKIIKMDFRKAYIGNYQVHEVIESYGFPECGTSYIHERDTVISVTYGKTDSTLNVLGRDVNLDKNGNYYSYHYGLRLWNDSISSYYMNGGLGCGKYEIYKGYRISNKP